MNSKIEEVRNLFEDDLIQAAKTGAYDELHLKYFSRTQGLTTLILKELPGLNEEDKKAYGPIINSMQDAQKNAIEQGKIAYEQQLQNNPLIDLTLPQSPKSTGMLHPVTQTIREMNAFFRYYGYSVVEGPEIENAENNFRKLNLPEGHPATDLQDTLFIKSPDLMLRTHTSSVEARVLSSQKLPVRVAFPGRCYRNETPNASNGSFFYQYQGVVVDKGITIQNLMSTLEEFHKHLFVDAIELRFRYKYYPEVSPGLGTDIRCQLCAGKGCEVCKYRGWLEVLGSGMIHHNTLKMCGIDPNVYTGFAFGMGLDRLVMSKFGITSQKSLYDGSLAYI